MSCLPQEVEECGLEESDGWDELSREALTIHKSQLSDMEAIGKGQYGVVFYAKLRYSPNSQPIEVAVKSTKVCVFVCIKTLYKFVYMHLLSHLISLPVVLAICQGIREEVF